MDKKICIIHTETTGIHETKQKPNKKNLFEFKRLVILNYIIGFYKNNKFVTEKKVKQIVKPRSMIIPEETIEYHGVTQQIAIEKGVDPELVISDFYDDLKTVDILVSHNIDFHLRTIIAEAIRYNINMNLTKIVMIDTINFSHDYGFIKLNDLASKLEIKKIPKTNKNNVELIKNVFFKLYDNFKKTL